MLYECDMKSKDGHRVYHVKCKDCGWETNMQLRFINKATRCSHVALDGGYKKTGYNWKDKRLQSIFHGMKERCYCNTNKSYRWYGAKGIKVYKKWLENPNLFEKWALENGYNSTLTINRIDENGDYCPKNCEWIPLEDNARYKSTTRSITVNEMTHSGREWSKILGLGTNTINTYIRNFGKTKTAKLIGAMLISEQKHRKNGDDWFKTYGVN